MSLWELYECGKVEIVAVFDEGTEREQTQWGVLCL